MKHLVWGNYFILMKYCILSLFFWGSIGTTPAIATETRQPYRLALFVTRAPGDPFWGLFTEVMREATDDLGMRLEVHYAHGNREKMREQILEATQGKNAADVVVFPNFKRGVASFLKVAENQKTPAFLVNAGNGDDEDIGEPRERFQYWIGELLPDEEEAGYLLANLLIEKAVQQGYLASDGRVHLLGIEGIRSDFASTERTKGLYRAVANHPEVFLRQIVPANWATDQAQVSFSILKRRYPQTTVVWAASDLMALGVANALEAEPNLLEQSVVVGGVDWTNEGLQAVREGRMHVSVGGHFMEGAWAAVLLHDYLHGSDFADIKLRWQSRMLAITQENIDYYSEHLTQRPWKHIDFKKFSRIYNPDQPYHFNLERVMEMSDHP